MRFSPPVKYTDAWIVFPTVYAFNIFPQTHHVETFREIDTLGAAGNRIAVTELGGRTVTYTYTYDDLYRLNSESIANDPHGVNGAVSYGYDPVGNRLNRSSSIAQVPSQSSTYDANDRLTSNSYDNNGNTIAANGNNYSYDFDNHLISLNAGSVREEMQLGPGLRFLRFSLMRRPNSTKIPTASSPMSESHKSHL